MAVFFSAFGQQKMVVEASDFMYPVLGVCGITSWKSISGNSIILFPHFYSADIC